VWQSRPGAEVARAIGRDAEVPPGLALRVGALRRAVHPQARAASAIIEHSSNCLGSKVSSAAAGPRQRTLVSATENSRPEVLRPEILRLEVQDAGTEESDQVLSWLHERTHRYRKRSMIKIGSRKK